MQTLTNSQRLERTLALALPALTAPGRGLLSHPHARELLPDFMATGSWTNRTAIPLMEAALRRARELADTDAVAASMVPYLVEHIEEESGEDILPDLALMGVDVPALLKRPAPPMIASLIGSQYFWIQHAHPVALIGYLEAIEGNVASPEAVEALIARTGYPRTAYTQLIEHAQRDIGHAAELHAFLDSLPLAPEHHELVGLSALHTVRCVNLAFDEVFARHERTAAARAGAR